jgi:hypothetical protein
MYTNIQEVLNGHLKALDKAGKRKQFEELMKEDSSVEVQINLAATILQETGVIPNHRSGPTNESSFSEGFDFKGDGRELRVHSTMVLGHLSEADARRSLGLPTTSGAEVRSKLKLTENESRQYVAYVRRGESEAAALAMACPRLVGQLKEAIGRGKSVSEFLESFDEQVLTREKRH